MKLKVLAAVGALGIVITVLWWLPVPVIGQAQTTAKTGAAARTGPAPKTSWGDPDLQGIWTDDHQTPLQRPAKYANREFLTDAEIAQLDKERGAILRQDDRGRKGTEGDVAGAYNAFFVSVLHTGQRTSLVVDPPDGRIPPLTPEAQKRLDIKREFSLALMQATDTCKQHLGICRNATYGPPSPKRAEPPPYYNTDRLNRSDGPEDRSLLERCLGQPYPDFSGFRRIVQSPDAVAVFYDVGQGQGWQRVIPIGSSPHPPAAVYEWHGDARGHWEGTTLVVDVTNFSPESDYRGAHEHLHLVERWTRLAPDTLEYAVTISDPTTWTKPWTVKQELTRQNEQANRVYNEPRCHEGNFGMIGMLANSRAEELAFAEGRGPDPATKDNASGGPTFFQEDNNDPFAGGE
jgi:hypothetical protein